jgi:hypothetical protein
MSAAPRQQSVEELRDDAISLAKSGIEEADIREELVNRMRKTGLDDDDIRTKLTATSELLESSEPWHAYRKLRASGSDNPLAAGPSQSKGKAPAYYPRFKTTFERPASPPNAELEELRRQVEGYQLQLAEARAAARQTTLPFAEPLRPHRMPDPEPFDGEYKDYRRWKFQMITKIEQDIRGRSTIAGYIFSRLKGNAARSALPWMERHTNVGDDASLWTTLDQIYNDPMHADRARRKLLEIRQGKTNLRTFNAEFRSVLADADEPEDTMGTKTRYLMALRYDLRDRMVTVEVPQEWTLSQVMARVAIVEENLYRTKLGTSQPHDSSRRGLLPRNGDPGNGGNDPMDWTPSLKVASAKPTTNTRRRAAWATPEQRAHRRDNNLCLRCGLSGHYANDCNLAKPSRPANLKASRIDEETSNATESNAGYDSEN